MIALGAIARAVGGSLQGDAAALIARVRAVDVAGPGDLGVVIDPAYLDRLDFLQAEALVVPDDCRATRANIIRVADPKKALIRVLELFAEAEAVPSGIEAGAHIAPSAKLGNGVAVAAGAYIDDEVILGDGVRIGANSVIGRGVVIGERCHIHPNVTIYANTILGRRVIIHAGSVIGSDGFGFHPTESGLRKIAHLGRVEIEDDVEIGANCTIDRATLEATRIGAGTKIDNLVQIGHNVSIGEHCAIVSQVGISGSVTLGRFVMVGGQAGIADHVNIGEGVHVGAQAGVHGDIASGRVLGTPSMPADRFGRIQPILQHLPEYRERVRALESKVEELERKLAEITAGVNPGVSS